MQENKLHFQTKQISLVFQKQKKKQEIKNRFKLVHTYQNILINILILNQIGSNLVLAMWFTPSSSMTSPMAEFLLTRASIKMILISPFIFVLAMDYLNILLSPIWRKATQ